MLLSKEFLANSGRFNLFVVGAFLGIADSKEEKEKQEETALRFFQHHELLPTKGDIQKFCDLCNMKFGEREDKSANILGFRYLCINKKCQKFGKKISPLTNTLFEHGKLPLAAVLKLLTCWYFRIPVTEAVIHAEVGSCTTAVQWYLYFREAARVVEGHDAQLIGGPTDIVECDESHLFRRKYKRGRALMMESVWIFGGISRLTKKRFAVKVDDRTKDTLHNEMAQHIHPESIIITDKWKGYNGSQCNFRAHFSVNHKKGYVDYSEGYKHHITGLDSSLANDDDFDTGEEELQEVVLKGLDAALDQFVSSDDDDNDPSFNPEDQTIKIKIHSNTIERSWRDMKDHMRHVRGWDDIINNYLGEYLYRRNILDETGSDYGIQFLKVLTDLRRVFPGLNTAKIIDKTWNTKCYCNSCTTKMNE